MLYELIGAGHSQNGKSYKKGDRIETDRNLEEMFHGKFKLVSGESMNIAEPSQPEIPKSVDTTTMADTVPPVKKIASGMTATVTFVEAKDTGLDIMKIGEDQFQIAKNGFLHTDGVFTRAEILIYLRNNAKVDSE